jgi:hypothetical protein
VQIFLWLGSKGLYKYFNIRSEFFVLFLKIASVFEYLAKKCSVEKIKHFFFYHGVNWSVKVSVPVRLSVSFFFFGGSAIMNILDIIHVPCSICMYVCVCVCVCVYVFLFID